MSAQTIQQFRKWLQTHYSSFIRKISHFVTSSLKLWRLESKKNQPVLFLWESWFLLCYCTVMSIMNWKSCHQFQPFWGVDAGFYYFAFILPGTVIDNSFSFQNMTWDEPPAEVQNKTPHMKPRHICTSSEEKSKATETTTGLESRRGIDMSTMDCCSLWLNTQRVECLKACRREFQSFAAAGFQRFWPSIEVFSLVETYAKLEDSDVDVVEGGSAR